jgi:methionyl-tRNA formyltransferase
VKKRLKVIFMGTPEFAVPALKALNKHGYDIELVVTQPDRLQGRGRKPDFPPVKKAAIELGYEVMQPASIKTKEFSDIMKHLEPDLLVVVAFGHILPENLLALPYMGAINIHASLLPKYRGPSPIHQAIINGENESGVTIMFIDKGLDTGDILLSAKEKIAPDDTSSTLHDRLAHLGADLLAKALKGLEAGTLKPVPQDHAQASYAPLLKKKDGHIDWHLPAETIESFIRGMTPWPGAFTFLDKKRLKIFKAQPVTRDLCASPGTVIKGFPDELCVATGDGALCILEIQGASGKRLLIKDFLRGCKIPPGTVLT